jgi:uncharacterized metal-binding protein
MTLDRYPGCKWTMPGGKTHETINITVLAAILAGIFYLTIWQETAILSRYMDAYAVMAFSCSYLFATFFLSPDLDTKSRPYKRWKMLRILWWPYRTIFKHRGFSHNMILGPITILLNFVLILSLFTLLSGVGLHSIPQGILIAATVGMILPIEIHIMSDCFISMVKSIC